MKISSILVAASLVFASGTALAFHCPKDIKAIDAALPNAKLSSAQRSEVKKLRDEGARLHKAKKHQESVDTLAKARKIIDI